VRTASDVRSCRERLPHPDARSSVNQEIRENLLARIRSGEPRFPGVVGFDGTVLPDLERALLAGHDVVLLGERGQGKTRLIRTIVGLVGEGRATFRWPPTRETVSATLAEVDTLTCYGAAINVFMLGEDAGLRRFMDAVARRNGGRVFTPSLDRLGRYVVSDYLRSRTGRRR